MCYGCFEPYLSAPGFPQTADEVTAQQRHLADLITDWYAMDGNSVGGAWHIQLDDWNIDFDMRIEEWHLDEQIPATQTPLGQELMALWNSMTEPERAAALGLSDGFYDPKERRAV